MNNRKTRQGRLRLLKALTIASGDDFDEHYLPDNWARPVVKSTPTPAHGRTTDEPESETNQTPMIKPDRTR